MTFMFLIVILGATHARAPVGFAGLAIGLALTLIHLDQHPGHQHLGESGAQHRAGACSSAAGRCRSCGCSSLAPIVGAIAAGLVHRMVLEPPQQEPPISGRAAQ